MMLPVDVVSEKLLGQSVLGMYPLLYPVHIICFALYAAYQTAFNCIYDCVIDILELLPHCHVIYAVTCLGIF